MNEETANRFIASLVKSLQALCHGYVDFEQSIEIIGHIYLNVDNASKYDYIVNEQVCKNEDESSVMFISNSFHAPPPKKVFIKPRRQSNQTCPEPKTQTQGSKENLDFVSLATDQVSRSASRESSQSLSASSEASSVSVNLQNRDVGFSSPSQNVSEQASRRKRNHSNSETWTKFPSDVSPIHSSNTSGRVPRDGTGDKREFVVQDMMSPRNQYTLNPCTTDSSKASRRTSSDTEKPVPSLSASTMNCSLDMEVEESSFAPSTEIINERQFLTQELNLTTQRFSNIDNTNTDKNCEKNSDEQLPPTEIDLTNVKEEIEGKSQCAVSNQGLELDQLDWSRSGNTRECKDVVLASHRSAVPTHINTAIGEQESPTDDSILLPQDAISTASLYPIMLHANTASSSQGYGGPVFPQNFDSSPSASSGIATSSINTSPNQSNPLASMYLNRRAPSGSFTRGNYNNYNNPLTPRPGKVPSELAQKFNKEENPSDLYLIQLANESFPELSDTRTMFHCDMCTFSTRLQFNLNQHKKKHEGQTAVAKMELPYTSTPISEGYHVCDSCGAAFQSKFALTTHIKSKHLLQFKFNCDVCQKGFNMLWNYQRHVASHTRSPGQKEDLQCKNCGQAFVLRANLLSHTRLCNQQRNKEKQHCYICGKDFETKDSLYTHMRGLHGGKVYSCRKCSKTFRWRSSLRYHVARCQVLVVPGT